MAEMKLRRKPGVMLSLSDTYSIRLGGSSSGRKADSSREGHAQTRTQHAAFRQDGGLHQNTASSTLAGDQQSHQRASARAGFRIEPLRLDPNLFRTRTSSTEHTQRKTLQHQAASSQRTMLVRLLALIACMMIVAAALSFGLPALTQIRMIRLDGLVTLSEHEVMELLGDMSSSSLVTFDASALAAGLAKDARIAEAHFHRQFPNTLVISIRERKPVAGILEQSSTGTRLILVDSEGVAYAAIDPESGFHGIPILSGIRFSAFQPGQSLPDALLPLTRGLAEVLEKEPEVLQAFSEIKVVQTGQSDPEVILYPAGSRIAVRAPIQMEPDTFKLSIAVLDILRARGYGAKSGEVDIREGTLIFRTKEAVSG